LVGHNGILPAADYLTAVSQRAGAERYWWLPTICWISASDSFLHFLCASGSVLSLLVVIGVAPLPALILLWASYLSLSTVCRDFLSFQWDILLLETGFLAIFLAPRQWLPRFSRETPPSGVVVWLHCWLLFRLMFMSGAVKLLSDDPAWWNFTALTFHYETQPLPTWIGWYSHQLPVWFQKTSVAIMFLIELLVPFLIFGTRRCRQIACGTFVVFMLLIAVTGNYCFFNWLTVALCVLLLDDELLRKVIPKRLESLFPQTGRPTKPPLYRLLGVATLALVIVLISGLETVARLTRSNHLPDSLVQVMRWVSPLRTVNSYGLFAVMTTTRPEIIVEGSNDGVTWLPYEFKWKPGDLNRAPGFVAPHQPRLDWQMWFAALGDYQSNPWFMNFMVRLLQGSPEVLALLKKNPFPDQPPRRLRAVLYEYRFTDIATRRRTGAWWHREQKGLYCPEITLREDKAASR